MTDKKLNKNAEGYSDPTASKAVNNYINDNETMKAGEIWEIKMNNGKYQDILILAVNGTVATCLNLLDMYASNLIEVICQGIRYIDTRKMQFAYQDMASNFIRKLSDDEFDKILDDVARKLGIDTKTVIQKVEVPVEEPRQPKKPAITLAANALTLNPIESEELIKTKAERDIFKGLYEKLLADVMKGA